ncbi:MAG TPA: hypothetical protein VFI43_04410 [Nitrosospira sp.]|nr:hypothetical protein [Nitrosospira sp.]
MKMNFDPNFFSQVGLDSGALTMLGAVVHSFCEPGEYRGVARRGAEPEAVFYISVDKNSPVAQANIDLAALVQEEPAGESENGCCPGGQGNYFVVNPKGYAVFHVSSGAGGYSVHVRKNDEDPKTKIFDSRELDAGDIFSAIIIRPGTYSVTNLVTGSKSEVIVSYPKPGKTPYRPPAPIAVDCSEREMTLGRIELQPGQGLNFHLKTRSRIKIELVKPDDGPGKSREPERTGWIKRTLAHE